MSSNCPQQTGREKAKKVIKEQEYTMRSEPGQGDIITVYNLNNEMIDGSDSGRLSWWSSLGEDYAKRLGHKGIVVKVSPGVTAAEAAKWLHRLADDIGSEGFMEQIESITPEQAEDIRRREREQEQNAAWCAANWL